jgi:osmoprotectant transport system permease protein
MKRGIIAAAGLVTLAGGGLLPMAATSFQSDQRAPVVVGAKTFTEQYILAQRIVDKLGESDIAARRRSGMGSIILFDALADGAIDCYVDYTGTVWSNTMKRSDMPSRDVVLAEMSAWLESEHGIVCLGSLGFENAYALAVRRQTADSLGLRTIDDLAAHADGLTLGSDYEFFNRQEWRNLQDEYQLAFSDLVSLDPTLMYSAVAEGEVDVITAFSTDGRIPAFDLVVLEDSRQALPPYDAVLLLSPKAAGRTAVRGTLSELVNSITNNRMRTANKLVDIDGVTIDSAASFLQSVPSE